MNSELLQSGTEIAEDLRISSDQSTLVASPVKTTGDLLAMLQQNPPRSFAMMRTTCGLLGTYLNQPGDQILFETLDDKRKSFRKFLADRKYTENSIRSYVYQLRLLLKTARRFGWRLDDAASDEWKALLTLAAEKKLNAASVP